MQDLRITAENFFYCLNLPYQMSDEPQAITRTCFKVQLQVVINQYGKEESQNTESEMQHFPQGHPTAIFGKISVRKTI